MAFSGPNVKLIAQNQSPAMLPPALRVAEREITKSVHIKVALIGFLNPRN